MPSPKLCAEVTSGIRHARVGYILEGRELIALGVQAIEVGPELREIRFIASGKAKHVTGESVRRTEPIATGVVIEPHRTKIVIGVVSSTHERRPKDALESVEIVRKAKPRRAKEMGAARGEELADIGCRQELGEPNGSISGERRGRYPASGFADGRSEVDIDAWVSPEKLTNMTRAAFQDLVVGIEEYEDVSRGVLDAVVSRSRGPRLSGRSNVHDSRLCKLSFEETSGVVGRLVVDHDDLVPVAFGQRALDRFANAMRAIVRRDDEAQLGGSSALSGVLELGGVRSRAEPAIEFVR
jgi:hypothetical protein